ncbi:MAG: hypothetical protein ACRDE2_14555 [Chitinophagaceae bacterium]
MFKKEILKYLVETSQSIGFKKTKYFFIKGIDYEITATLHFGLAIQTLQRHIFVNVTIGVSHKRVEELYAKLTGNKNSILKPTIGSQLGYLMPANDFKEWDFVEKQDNNDVLNDLLYCIKTYGFPYQEKMSDFNTLFKAFEKREPGILHIARDRYLPILYYLKGEKQKGLKFIEEAIERQKRPFNEADILNFNAAEQLTIVGSGIGKVDPEYLKFVEEYKKL